MFSIKTVLDAASSNWKLTFSFLGAAIWFIAVVVLLAIWRDGITALVAMVGTGCGWAAGILLAPYEPEKTRFAAISKGVSGLISGYLLAKLDKVFDLVTDKSAGVPLVLTEPFIRGFFVGLGCFIVATITVFVARTYWQAVEESE